MANFTPQEIEQFLQEFFDVVGTRQYTGARYVPIFGRKNEDTCDWDNSDAYEPLTIVIYQGNSYTSKQYVPKDINITDTNYWVQTGNWNAQIEQYRQEVLQFQSQINEIRDDLESDYVPFPDYSQYSKYGNVGQVLSTLADGTTKWENPVVPSEEQAEEVITAWLDEHPEATTTVQDGAITTAKLANGSVTDEKLAQTGGILQHLSETRDTLFYYADTNYFHNATWVSGLYQSFSNFSNNAINANNYRLSVQLELTEYANKIKIVPMPNIQFNAGVFDSLGNALSNKGAMNTDEWSYSSDSNNIRYVRISYGFSPNKQISIYNDEIVLFIDDHTTLLNAYNNIEALNEDLKNVDILESKLSEIENITYDIAFNSSNIELGTLSTGRPTDSTIRARSKYFIIPKSGIMTFYCLNKKYQYNVVMYDGKSESSNTSTGFTNDTSTIDVKSLRPNCGQIKLLIKHTEAPYDISEDEFDDLMLYASYDSMSGNNIRLNIMTHNCGKFNYGNEGGYSGSDVNAKMQDWRDMIANKKPDIILAQELSTYFDSAQTKNAYDEIFKPFMPFKYFISYGTILSKVRLGASWQLDLTVEYNGNTYSREAGCSFITIDGVDIVLCSAHLIPDLDPNCETVREMERDLLITALDSFEYVIIGGDFNEPQDSFYDEFISAGYQLANHGIFGTYNTVASNRPIDNIIVKGFTFYNATSNSADAITSDHYPIVADVHMKRG